MKLIKISLISLLVLLIVFQAVTVYRAERRSDDTPIITSDVDKIQIPCQYTKEDLLQGLSAYDEADGNITEKILIGDFSDFTQRGVSSLEYAVYDKDGNAAVFTREVVFSDYVSPRILISNPLVFKPATSIYDIPLLILKGKDVIDGDITSRLLITFDDVDFYEPGKYNISVNLKNSFGDEVNMDLPIHILDPEISGYLIAINEPIIYVDKGSVVIPEDHIAAVVDENTYEHIPDKEFDLTINSDVDTSKDGIYEIQISVISRDRLLRGESWMIVVVGDYGG